MDQTLYLIVSIDVEEDMPNWQIEDSTTIRNLSGLPHLQKLFDKYGIRPTYLLNYPYATNSRAVEFFSGIQNRCEIGAHMHPWNTPPLEDGEEFQIEYPSNLNYKKQFEKITNVTEAIKKSFGFRPLSYRAGKFGFNNDTKDILTRLGYHVDTSISPMVSWKGNNGPCFLRERAFPYWIDVNGYNLLELPVTIGLNRNIPDILERIYLNVPRITKVRGLLSRDYLNLVDLIWLYPALFSSNDMIRLIKAQREKGLRVFNVFFHSSELSIGESIYTNSEEELKRYHGRLDNLFSYCINDVGMKSVTLNEYYLIECKSV